MQDTSNPLLEVFIFETSQLSERLEEIILETEKENSLSVDNINEIFRIMHTIKGSSAMMMFENISSLAHAIEDLFFFVRESKTVPAAYSDIAELILQANDFIKTEIAKIVNNMEADGDSREIADQIHACLAEMKAGGEKAAAPKTGSKAAPKPAPKAGQAAEAAPEAPAAQAAGEGIAHYTAEVRFGENCQMENIRAFGLVHALKDLCVEISTRPEDLLEDESAADWIAKNGLFLAFTSMEDMSKLESVIDQTMFVKSFALNADGVQPAEAVEDEDRTPERASADGAAEEAQAAGAQENAQALREDAQEKKENLLKSVKQSQISVNITKLDALMDLVGEIVINEAMVTHNPDLSGLQLDNFQKAARQLRKLTDELQDLTMSMRMIPVANTFHKMTRIVRDMSKRLDKEADLVILGEETEVDKNIIDNLSDPLMHLIRNAMDHGLETREERVAAGKPENGQIRLEAVNTGGDVLITVADDGKGLNREKILKKAKENGLLTKPESEMTDREVFSIILLPGFSTKEQVTEFSGRGVGMDVVRKNIEKVGGSVSIDSEEGRGTTVTIKIPLTLAIIDGMMFAVGKTVFTVPTIAIKEVFRPTAHTIFKDPDNHEMIMLRGQCLPVLRLHEAYAIDTEYTDLNQGIMLVIESESVTVCLFADRLIGEQQVVVKPLPYYLMRFGIKNKAGIGGCTILGDGSISLILDTSELMRCQI